MLLRSCLNSWNFLIDAQRQGVNRIKHFAYLKHANIRSYITQPLCWMNIVELLTFSSRCGHEKWIFKPSWVEPFMHISLWSQFRMGGAKSGALVNGLRKNRTSFSWKNCSNSFEEMCTYFLSNSHGTGMDTIHLCTPFRSRSFLGTVFFSSINNFHLNGKWI